MKEFCMFRCAVSARKRACGMTYWLLKTTIGVRTARFASVLLSRSAQVLLHSPSTSLQSWRTTLVQIEPIANHSINRPISPHGASPCFQFCNRHPVQFSICRYADQTLLSAALHKWRHFPDDVELVARNTALDRIDRLMWKVPATRRELER